MLNILRKLTYETKKMMRYIDMCPSLLYRDISQILAPSSKEAITFEGSKFDKEKIERF